MYLESHPRYRKSRKLEKLSKKLVSKKSKCHCPICDDCIDDAVHDSIFCEGSCQAWVHKGCGGLSKSAHEKAKSLPNWQCPLCRFDTQSQEMLALREQVDDLNRKVSSLQSSVESQLTALSEEVATITKPSSQASPSLSVPKTSRVKGSAPPVSVPVQRKPDRKFNLIVTGLKESAPKTPRLERISHDFREVSSLFSPLLPSFVESTIHDCIRLGKFSPDRSRPLLVTLSRSRCTIK